MAVLSIDQIGTCLCCANSVNMCTSPRDRDHSHVRELFVTPAAACGTVAFLPFLVLSSSYPSKEVDVMVAQVMPQKLNDLTVLPITYSDDSVHFLYIRAHNPGASAKAKAKSLPSGRTLFVVNVPPDATERELTLLFKSCGTIEKVVFGSPQADVLDNEEGNSDGSDEEGEEDMEDDEEEDIQSKGPASKRRKLDKNGRSAKLVMPQVHPLPTPPLRTLRPTGRFAYVVFLDSSSLDRALALPRQPPKKTSSTSSPPYARPWLVDPEAPTGLAHYTALYDACRPPLDSIQSHADSSIEMYDYNVEKRKRALQKESKYKKGEAIVDEDGFTLVTRGGAYGQAVGGGVGVASKKFMGKMRKGKEEVGGTRKRKKGPKEKEAFYAFQVHEKKRKGELRPSRTGKITAWKERDRLMLYFTDLMDLKANFEKDKEKIEQLRASKKFKPY